MSDASQAKREQVRARVRVGLHQRPAEAGRPLVRRAGGGSVAPLSFSQRRLWFLDQLVPGSAFYNVPVAYRLVGDLDVGALEGAFSAVVARHEVLRTSFGARVDALGGQPAQVVGEPWPVVIAVTEAATEQEARDLAAQEAGRPFDLGSGRLLRVRLVRLGPDDHVLLVTMHHIVCDAWSLGVLLREVSGFYQELAEGGEPSGEALPVQYADFSVWQREWLSGEVLEGQLGYWREQLGGLEEVLELPLDRVRPPVLSYAGARVGFTVPAGVAEGLRGLGRECGATLFMVLLAGFDVLVGRWAGREDVAVGSPIAGRNRSEVEGLIGFFVNTLVLRVGLGGEPSFRELVGRVREAALGAYAHQDVPFEALVEDLAPVRDLSRNPLVQMTFQLLHPAGGTVGSLTGEEPASFPGLSVDSWYPERSVTRFDLSLTMLEEEGQLRGQVVFSTELFDHETIRRLADGYLRVLAAVAADPDAPVSDVDLTGEAEREELVKRGTSAAPAERAPLALDLFAGQARRHPGATAVVYGAERLTYRDLDQRSARLARALRAAGIGPGALVGVCLDRSAALVTAVLGVLRAGAAYVPLDPAYPAARLDFMVRDSGAGLVLTGAEVQGTTGWGVPVWSLGPDAEPPQGAAEGSAQAGAEIGPSSAAYVIYTSGSTGTPKGVVVEHGNLANLLRSVPASPGKDGGAWCLAHSMSFDFSVWEMWGALAFGRALVVPSWDEVRDPALLLDLLCREKVTVLNITPSAFYEFDRAVEEHAELAVSRLAVGTVIFGGEALDASRLKRWDERFGGRCQLVNMYGITEGTVHVTATDGEPPARGRSAVRFRGWGCRCLTGRGWRCRRGCRVSCTWGVRGWRGGTWGGGG